MRARPPFAAGRRADRHAREYGTVVTRATYAPHTETGYRAPPNKTLLLLLNGLLAKRGVRSRSAS
ncbi:MAG TPA: hypothetical protein VGI67_01870 [Thermoleophilaceae bacterium]|jgi:hypothetical protein